MRTKYFMHCWLLSSLIFVAGCTRISSDKESALTSLLEEKGLPTLIAKSASFSDGRLIVIKSLRFDDKKHQVGSISEKHFYGKTLVYIYDEYEASCLTLWMPGDLVFDEDASESSYHYFYAGLPNYVQLEKDDFDIITVSDTGEVTKLLIEEIEEIILIPGEYKGR